MFLGINKSALSIFIQLRDLCLLKPATTVNVMQTWLSASLLWVQSPDFKEMLKVGSSGWQYIIH